MSTRPWRSPNAPARMAGIRFASGSTTTTRRERASRSMKPFPKISLVPTAKSFVKQIGRQNACQDERIDVALVIGAENIRTALRQLLHAAHSQREAIEGDDLDQARNQVPECIADRLWTWPAHARASSGSSARIAFQPAKAVRAPGPPAPLAALCRTASTRSRTV